MSSADTKIKMAYCWSNNGVRTVNRRWGFLSLSVRPITRTILQIDNRPLYELTGSTSINNDHNVRHLRDSGRSPTYVVYEQEHPFHVDQQHDYYPTNRIAHNYVRIENDPVNVLPNTAPTTEDEGYAEAANIIGSIRDGYHRKVEHIGGTPRIEDVYDISNQLTSMPLFPPMPVTAATPDRVFLRTTDMGYKHYIKSLFSSSSPYAALETKDVTGKKTWIWDGGNANFKRTTVIPGDLLSNEQVKVKDVEVLGNAALNSVHSNLNNKFLPDDKAWEVFNIPGRTKVKIGHLATEITQYSTDYNTVVSQIIMTLGGNVVITDGTRIITMNGTSVNVT